jgi:hypothetical protein
MHAKTLCFTLISLYSKFKIIFNHIKIATYENSVNNFYKTDKY